MIIVADKLQTGFDEDAPCIFYIDRKLNSGVKAVQTISRLNRPAIVNDKYIWRLY